MNSRSPTVASFSKVSATVRRRSSMIGVLPIAPNVAFASSGKFPMYVTIGSD
jgi:hypothetical protein